jgi:diguanylate cyclase (GGDEF)-like protein
MTENLLFLLSVLVAANIVLITVALGRAWMRRRRAADHEETAKAMDADAARSSGVGRVYAPSSVPVFEPMPSPNRTDPLTGMLLPAEWNRILFDEDARIHRYGRPATVVLVELDGLDRLVAILGQEAGDRILPAVADSLSRHARGADHVARLGPGRFGILLPETGEVEAVNYVERVRAVCELWLESGAIALRLAIGWASPAVDTSLIDAFNEAQERMFVEMRRGARRGSAVAADGPPSTPGLEGAHSPA